MAKTKHQKLADHIRIFQTQVIKHEKGLIERFGQPLPDCFRNDIFACWLLCKTPDELQNRQYKDFEKEKRHHNAHAVYYKQWQNPQSRLWENLDQPALPHFQAWLEKDRLMNHTYRKTGPSNYPYRPNEPETLLTSLDKTSRFIKSKPNRYQKDLAKSYHKDLVTAAFKGTDIQIPLFSKKEKQPAYALTILRHFNCSLESVYFWEKQKFLKLAATRYPISRQRARMIVEKATEEFLTGSRMNLWSETLMALWTLLACANYRRRFCTVSDIFRVTFQDLKKHQARYTIKVNNMKVPISGFFAHMLDSYSDQRRKEQPILSICRSTLEHHLKYISIGLGFIDAPVTPETFLEYPHDLKVDVRYHPANKI